MIDQRLFQGLHRHLFSGSALATYAVLDGCMVDQLPQRLAVSGLEHACLFSGPLDPMLEAAAPHIVRITSSSAFTERVLREGWNANWGIVLQTGTDIDLATLRQHLRRQLRVSAPGGVSLFFRFYDPRAFRAVVPTLAADQHGEFLGPARKAWVEAEDPSTLLLFQPVSVAGGPVQPLPLAT